MGPERLGRTGLVLAMAGHSSMELRACALVGLLVLAACGGGPRGSEAGTEDDGTSAGQTPPAQIEPHDWLVVADERIGPVSDTTSEQDLIALLGPGRVIRRETYLAEGFCGPGSVLYPGTPDELEVLWTDSTYTLPSMARLSTPGSRWRSSQGVGVGTPLAELEQKSGGPIRFSGFGWDYGGGTNWSEGGKTLGLRLAPNPDSLDQVMRNPTFMQVMGDQSVRSDHPLLRRMDVRVDRVSVSFGRPTREHECTLP